MTFIGLSFLFALPLIAVPLILHYFARRRRVIIEWGAMQFLSEAVVHRARARRLQQWLLLALRMFAVAALVFALAQPLIPGRWWGSSATVETVVVLDNSASMSRSVDGGTLFESAVLRVEEELGKLDPESFVRVLLTSPGPTWLIPNPVHVRTSKNQLLGELTRTKPTGSSNGMLVSLSAAIQAIPPPTVDERQIVVVTDRQASDWQLEDLGGWKRMRERLQKGQPATTVRLVSAIDERSGSQRSNNVAITRMESPSEQVGVGDTFQTSATIQNFSNQPLSDLKVSWFADGELQHVASIEQVDAFGAHDVSWKHALNQAGSHLISCQVAHVDALSADNENAFVVEVVDRIPVLIVENSPPYADVQSDSWFIRAALGRGDAKADWKSVFDPSAVHVDELKNVPLSEFRAVVIPSLGQLPREMIDRLSGFVHRGGGLWVALGPRTDAAEFNQNWYRHTGGLVPLAIERMVGGSAVSKGAPGISALPPDHVATRQLADVHHLDLGEIKVLQRQRFASIGNATHSTLLETVDGEPLAVETTFGRGRVIQMGIPLRLQWSDLVKSQSFVVMMQDWLAWLTQPAEVRHNLESGERISLGLDDHNRPFTHAMIVEPDGNEVRIESIETSRGSVISLRPRAPGIYWLRPHDSRQSVAFHVSRSARESNLTPLSGSDGDFLMNTGGVSIDGNAVASVPRRQQRLEPLWGILLCVLMGTIAVELWLSTWMSRLRSDKPFVKEVSAPSSRRTIVAGRVA